MGESARRLDPRPRCQDAAPKESRLPEEEAGAESRGGATARRQEDLQEEEVAAVEACHLDLLDLIDLLDLDLDPDQSCLALQVSWSLSRVP